MDILLELLPPVCLVKKNSPYLPPEDGLCRFRGGLLTLGSSSFQAFPFSQSENSGLFWNLSPITVAGAVSASHGLPCPINRKDSVVKDKNSITQLFG